MLEPTTLWHRPGCSGLVFGRLAEPDTPPLPDFSSLKPPPVQTRRLWWPCSWTDVDLQQHPSTRWQTRLKMVNVKAEEQTSEYRQRKHSHYSSRRGKPCHSRTVRNSEDLLSRSLLGQNNAKCLKTHITERLHTAVCCRDGFMTRTSVFWNWTAEETPSWKSI